MTTTIETPARIAALPADDHGRPVPWFTARVNGKPDLRTMAAAKITTAIGERRCWICGQPLDPDDRMAFVVGPYSLFSRCSSEPPSDRLCALYAVRECPFLANPGRARRPKNLPAEAAMAGNPILDNPGLALVWLCRGYRVEADTNGRVLLHLPSPSSILAYHGGQPARRTQLDEGFAAAAQRARTLLADQGMPDTMIDATVATNRALLYNAVMLP